MRLVRLLGARQNERMDTPKYWAAALIESEKVFEDRAFAARWLVSANTALGGAVPRDLLETNEGWQMVRRELAAVEHGLPT